MSHNILVGNKYAKFTINVKVDGTVKENYSIVVVEENIRGGYFKRTIKVRDLKTKKIDYLNPDELLYEFSYIDSSRIIGYHLMDDGFSRINFIEKYRNLLEIKRGSNPFMADITSEELHVLKNCFLKNCNLCDIAIKIMTEKQFKKFIVNSLKEFISEQQFLDLVPKDKVKNWANIAKDIYPGIESKGEAEISAELVVKLENYKDKVIAVNPISFTTDKNFEFGFNKAFIEKKEVVGKNLHITFRMEWLDMPLDLTNKVEFWKKLNREFNGEMKSIAFFSALANTSS